MKNSHIEEVIARFREKTNSANYKVGEYHTLQDTEDSLLHPDWYPESAYELDAGKIENFLRHELQEYQRQVREMVEGKKKSGADDAGELMEQIGYNKCVDDILSHPLLNDK